MSLNQLIQALTRRSGLPGLLLIMLALLSGACSRDPVKEKARHVANGDKYAAESKLAEATIEYRQALENDPLDGNVRLKLAEAYAKLGQGSQAALEFVRVADVMLDRADLQVRAGAILLAAGRFDDAKVRAEKALAIAPRDIQAQILLANSLAGLKDLNAAVAEIEEAIALEPDRSATYTNLGVLEVSRGKRDAAEQAFKKAIELDGRSSVAYLALANFYWMNRRLDDAERALSKALALDPENTLVLRAMANFAITQHRWDEAEKHLKKIVDVTQSPTARIALADFYISRQSEATARAVLQPLSDSPSDAAPANIRLAALDHAAGKKQEAYARLDKILADDKTNLQALLIKSTMLLTDGKADEALVPAQLAVQSHSDATAAYFTLGRIQAARQQHDAAIAAYKETLRLNPRATGAQVALARLHLASGKASESVGFAQDALKADPSNAAARLALVRGLLARGDLQQAAPEIAKLSSEFPSSATVHVQKGILLGRQKNFSESRKEFEAALKLDPKSTEALGGLVALDLAAKQPVAALARVKDGAAQADASPTFLMLTARTYAATGDLQSAERMLRRVLEKDSSYLPAYSALGQLYLRRGQLDAALAEFESIASREEKPVAPLTLIGIILDAQGKSAEAKAKFERVLALDPSAPVAANNLAWMYAESSSNLELAVQLAQTAQRGLPDSPEVNNTLGLVYYKKNLFTLAIPPLKASVDKEPSNPMYHLHLGLAYAKSGNTGDARRSLEQALALKPDVPGAAEARSVLESLKTVGS